MTCSIDATEETGRVGRLINHSQQIYNQNLVTKVSELNGKPHLCFIAKKNTDINEELLYAYGERRRNVFKDNPWLLS